MGCAVDAGHFEQCGGTAKCEQPFDGSSISIYNRANCCAGLYAARATAICGGGAIPMCWNVVRDHFFIGHSLPNTAHAIEITKSESEFHRRFMVLPSE